MRDEKDDDLMDDDIEYDGDDDAPALLNKDVPEEASNSKKGMAARRKLELLREQKELRRQLGDDFDFPLDDDL